MNWYRKRSLSLSKEQFTWGGDNGAPQQNELAFVIGVIGELTAVYSRPVNAALSFHSIDRDSVHEVMTKIDVGLDARVKNVLANQTSVTSTLSLRLRFRQLDDFLSPNVAQQIPELRDLLRIRANLLSLQKLKLQFTSDMESAYQELQAAGNQLGVHVTSALVIGTASVAEEAGRLVNLIDQKTYAQLNIILEHPKFRQLRSTWLGIIDFVFRTETSKTMKLKCLDCSRSELTEVLCLDTDGHAFFERIFGKAFASTNGDPLSLLIGDFQFNHQPESLNTLKRIADVCALAHCPFVTAPSPGMFGLESWGNLGALTSSVADTFDNPEFIEWNDFRTKENSRFIYLVLPGLPMNEWPCNAASYSENAARGHAAVVGDKSESLLIPRMFWINGAYSLTSKVAECLSETKSVVAMQGYAAGLVFGRGLKLPSSQSADERRVDATKLVILHEQVACGLTQQGFIPLFYSLARSDMYILNAQSVHHGRFAQGNAEETTDDSALANSLPSILTLSRFVHYVRCLCRSRIGSFSTHLAIEQFIKEKLTEYVAPFNPALNSMYPLAAVVVSIADGLDPGYVDARISLRPKLMTQTLNHDITSQIRLSYLLWGSR